METKKNPQRNMEKYKNLFFETGLIISLSIVLASFEWKSSDSNESSLVIEGFHEIPVEMIILPEKQKPKPLPATTMLKILDNSIDVPEDPIIDIFDKQKTGVPPVITFPRLDTVIEVTDTNIITVPPVLPEFPGGETAMYTYLENHISYPRAELEQGIDGTVYVSFVIEKTGAVGHVELLRGVSRGLDNEALRVVENMPAWSCGKNSLGRPVRVKMTLPVRFKLLN